MNVRALDQQTESKCRPYSNRLTECAGLTATEPEDVRSLQQLIGRMRGPYSNILVGCAGLTITDRKDKPSILVVRDMVQWRAFAHAVMNFADT